MAKYSFTIARYTLLESIRDRFLYLLVIGLLILSLLSVFIAEIAITESQESQIALLASSLRLFGVIIIVLFISSSMLRELQDKSFELILAKSISRTQYYFGKLLASLCLSFLVGIVLSLPFFLLAETSGAMLWCLSLCFELFLLSCIALLCVFTSHSITFVFLATISFYALARTITTIQLIASSPILESNSLWHQFVSSGVNMIAYLIPKFDQYTKTVWLIYAEISMQNLYYVIVQTIIFSAILITATLFDLNRKEL